MYCPGFFSKVAIGIPDGNGWMILITMVCPPYWNTYKGSLLALINLDSLVNTLEMLQLVILPTIKNIKVNPSYCLKILRN